MVNRFAVTAARSLFGPAGPATIRVRDGRVTDEADAADGVVDTGPAGLLLPAPANAHDHGRYFSPLSFGISDQPLEPWLAGLALQPTLDPHLNALAYLSRLARRGVAATMHLHRARPIDILIEEAAQTCSAAELVGIRLAFAVPLQDRNHVAYSCGPGALPEVGPPWHPERRTPVSELLACADHIAAENDSARVEIQYGPLGPQWATDELLGAVAERSATTGRRVHMHLLETERQRQWADAAHPHGLLRHLDNLGLLSPRLSIAHGVWLRPNEIQLLAERGVTAVVNTSSNLRLRSGTAPVAEFAAAGLRWSMGLDGNCLDDDNDAFREMRLLALLHAGTGLDARIEPAAVFRAAVDGATAVHRGPSAWGLTSGAAADMVVLDTTALERGLLVPPRDDLALLFTRGSSTQVRHLWVGGRHVVRDGTVTGVDEAAALTELNCQAEALAPHSAWRRLPAVQERIVEHYRQEGHLRPTSCPWVVPQVRRGSQIFGQ